MFVNATDIPEILNCDVAVPFWLTWGGNTLKVCTVIVKTIKENLDTYPRHIYNMCDVSLLFISGTTFLLRPKWSYGNHNETSID